MIRKPTFGALSNAEAGRIGKSVASLPKKPVKSATKGVMMKARADIKRLKKGIN